MVEVYVPFLLLLMSWHKDDPQGTIEVSQRLHIGIEECEAAGREIAALRAEQGDDGREFVWQCVEPAREIEVYHPVAAGE